MAARILLRGQRHGAILRSGNAVRPYALHIPSLELYAAHLDVREPPFPARNYMAAVATTKNKPSLEAWFLRTVSRLRVTFLSYLGHRRPCCTLLSLLGRVRSFSFRTLRAGITGSTTGQSIRISHQPNITNAGTQQQHPTQGRLTLKPCPACPSSASHAGGFTVGLSNDRASYSKKQANTAEVMPHPSHLHATHFPLDIFHDEPQSANEVCVASFHALLPTVKRIAVHGVRRRKAEPPPSEKFGVYLFDDEGNEHPFLYYRNAASATYAALRIAQIYRLGVEFGNFNDPKSPSTSS